MADHPPGTILIEILGIYDGWSVAQLPDGTLVNRWAPDDCRHAATQVWIDREQAWIDRQTERRAGDGRG